MSPIAWGREHKGGNIRQLSPLQTSTKVQVQNVEKQIQYGYNRVYFKNPHSWVLFSWALNLTFQIEFGNHFLCIKCIFRCISIFYLTPNLRTASPWQVPTHIIWKQELECGFSFLPCFLFWTPRDTFPSHFKKGLGENRAGVPDKVLCLVFADLMLRHAWWREEKTKGHMEGSWETQKDNTKPSATKTGYREGSQRRSHRNIEAAAIDNWVTYPPSCCS